ncbi:MAG: HAD-IIB family hydrolase [Magnetococcus sp. WYHC-3]
MSDQYLICSNLDRTLLPNGLHEESPGARRAFARLASDPRVRIVYASGRDLNMVLDSLRGYDLPRPDFIISDVGAAIHAPSGSGWRAIAAWDDVLRWDWIELSAMELATLFRDFADLELQERSRQHPFKLSFYAPTITHPEALLGRVRTRLDESGVRANMVWSIDEINDIGMLDLLPPHSDKRHALEFLMQRISMPRDRVCYAGDGGNDLSVLCSPIPSVLVANASDWVRQAALAQSESAGLGDALYLARGKFGMNGNYAAGVVEGVAHFLPDLEGVIRGE